MSYTYSSFTTALAAEMEVSPTDADFLAILPVLIDDSEMRIYRDLDLLASIVTVTGTTSSNTRNFALPTSSGHMLVVDAINVLDSSGTRYPVTPATREGVDFLYPSNTPPGSPSFPKIFARIDDLNVLFGPAPDSTYAVEVIGTIRPTPLSASNTTTYLSNYLSDLFFAGAMISAAGYMRNFGSQGDDPKMATSWQSQYDARLASAKQEEMRKSYVSAQSSAGTQAKKDA